MPPVTAPAREVRELQRRFKSGYTLERTGGDHFRVMNGNGEPVRDEKGKPLTIPGTPHGGRQTKNIEARLRRAGVLREEREKTRTTTRTTTDEQERRRIEHMRETMAVRSRNRQKIANALYDRLASALPPGVVDLPGTAADLAYIGVMIARERGEQSTPDLMTNSIQRVLQHAWVTPSYQETWNDLADRLERAPDRVETFYALVRQSRGLPETVTIRRSAARSLESDEWPFRVELLPLDALTVDHDYQRPVPWSFVRKMAATFDERLVGTIDVSERRRGAVFAILDGQLRYEAMRLTGKSTLWASIYSGFDKAAEARFFLHKNRDRKAIHPFYTFKARVAAGDESAIAIARIVEENGYRLAVGAAKPGTSTESNIVAITALEEAYARQSEHRQESLSPVLAMLSRTTRGLEYGQNAVLIRGLSRFFAAYGDEEIDLDRLVAVLTERSPGFLLGRARERSRAQASTAEMYAAKTFLEEYNMRAPRGEKLPVRV